jgi:hypothetical protein
VTVIEGLNARDLTAADITHLAGNDAQRRLFEIAIIARLGGGGCSDHSQKSHAAQKRLHCRCLPAWV